MFRCVKIKKGELNISSPFFETLVLSAQLERVSPVEKHVVPVAAETGSAIRNSRGADSIAQTQVLPCLVDVVAQVLRVAYLLRALVPEWSPDPRSLAVMQQFLMRQTAFEGGAPFDAAPAAPPYCVWAAMFAEQALDLARTASRNVVDREMAAYLV